MLSIYNSLLLIFPIKSANNLNYNILILIYTFIYNIQIKINLNTNRNIIMTSQTKNPIKYILIGNVDTSKIITEFTTISANSKTKKIFSDIFNKICKTTDRKFDERNKITASTENYFFTVIKPNIVYLILVDASYQERFIFELIYEINNEGIPTMLNEGTKELNPKGRQALKAIVDRYQDVKNLNKLNQIQNDVNDIKETMQNTIQSTMTNLDNVKDLENKSQEIRNNAAEYRNNARDLQTKTCWMNSKWTIIIIIVVVVIALVIILPIAL